MKVISDKIKMAIATALHSFDLLPSGTFDEMKEKLSDDAVIKRYRNDYVFHARVCSLTASVLSSVEDDIATLTRQRDLAVEALEKQGHSAGCRKNAFGDICTCGLDDLLSTIKEAM